MRSALLRLKMRSIRCRCFYRRRESIQIAGAVKAFCRVGYPVCQQFSASFAD